MNRPVSTIAICCLLSLALGKTAKCQLDFNQAKTAHDAGMTLSDVMHVERIGSSKCTVGSVPNTRSDYEWLLSRLSDCRSSDNAAVRQRILMLNALVQATQQNNQLKRQSEGRIDMFKGHMVANAKATSRKVYTIDDGMAKSIYRGVSPYFVGHTPGETMAAIMIASELGEEQAIQPLHKLCKSPDANVRMIAATGLAMIRHQGRASANSASQRGT